VSCLSNARQITTGCLTFAGDNDGWMPGCDYNTGYGVGQAIWASGEPRRDSLLVVHEYIGNWELFRCPSAEQARDPASWLWRHGWNFEYRFNIHYGGIKLAPYYAGTVPEMADYPLVGAHLLGSQYVFAAKVEAAEDPTKSVLMSDGVHFADYHDHAGAGVGATDVVTETWLVATAQHHGHTRSTVAYIDGHVLVEKAWQMPGQPLPEEPYNYAAIPTFMDPYIDVYP